MVKWSARPTGNLAVLGLSFALATLLDLIVLGCPEFRSLATLVNSQLVASSQLGFLIML